MLRINLYILTNKIHKINRSLYFETCNSTSLFHITTVTIFRNYKFYDIGDPIINKLSIPERKKGWGKLYGFLKSSHWLGVSVSCVCRC